MKMKVAEPIEWTSQGVVMLDQRRLPNEVVHHTFTDYREVAGAIRDIRVRKLTDQDKKPVEK